jgi:dolichol kinase
MRLLRRIAFVIFPTAGLAGAAWAYYLTYSRPVTPDVARGLTFPFFNHGPPVFVSLTDWVIFIGFMVLGLSCFLAMWIIDKDRRRAR